MPLTAQPHPGRTEQSGQAEREPTSDERLIEKPSAVTEKDSILATLRISGFQRKEIQLAFPNLADAVISDLEIKKIPETRGKGIFGSPEDCKILEQELKRINATAKLLEEFALPEQEARVAYYELREENQQTAPALSDGEKERIALETYLHAMDVLRYEPGDDPDAYEEDLKDRRRQNPIAKQTARRRLQVLLDETKRHFPEDFKNPSKSTIPEQMPFEEVHPTSMLPPAMPKLQDDLWAKLSTMKEEKK